MHDNARRPLPFSRKLVLFRKIVPARITKLEIPDIY